MSALSDLDREILDPYKKLRREGRLFRLSRSLLGQKVASRLEIIRNRHLDLAQVAHLCTRPSVVERVASVLGPNLLLWRTNFFYPTANGATRLPWHRSVLGVVG